MNLKRFTAKSSRDALAMVKAAFGDDAVVMSTKPCAEGVEVLAMAPESIQQIERVGGTPQPPVHAVLPAARPPLQARGPSRVEPRMDSEIAQDVEQLQMSTLTFQDYVRDRMLRRREAERVAEVAAAEPAPAAPPAPPLPPVVAPIEAARARHAARREVPVLRDEVPSSPRTEPIHAPMAPVAGPALATRGEQEQMMTELRSMRGLIEQRFGALAFMEKLQRQPRQARLAQRLLDAGFSPALIRKLAESLPLEGDEILWAAGILERNLPTSEREAPLEDTGGIYALVGATGVGKTTSTAKLAAAFATRHGAANLGLITLDAYRVGAHEQLRTYGRILGVPVHTAHDRASLEDLLELLTAKRMVLIDTAGMAQRDTRTRELLEMLSHRSINRLLVVNASAQGETIEDQLAAYGAPSCRGLVLSKLDEAVKLGPALDSMIRHKLKVLAVANGQRVPEDWHRLSASALVQRALKSVGGPAWRLDENDVSLIFAGQPAASNAAASPLRAG
jgi:flagellar biosynthesis protein FlhF